MSYSKWFPRPFLDLVLWVFLLATSPFVWPQAAVTTGSLRGLVADNSGAVITAAVVVLTSRSNGQSLARASNSAGIFVFPSQPVGLYAVEVSAPGFRKEIVQPVLVQVG